MVMGHFVHGAGFHYGENISALGRETSSIDEPNVWLGTKGGKFGEWQPWTRLSLLNNSVGWYGTTRSSLHSGFKHLTLLLERLSYTILLLSEMTEKALHVNSEELGDSQSKCMRFEVELNGNEDHGEQVFP